MPPLPDQHAASRLRRRLSSCPKCGYSLKGLRCLTCPECGHELTATDLCRGPDRPRWKQLALGPAGVACLFLIGAALTWVVQTTPVHGSVLTHLLFIGIWSGRRSGIPPLVPGLLAICLFWWLVQQESNPFMSVDEDIIVIIAAGLTVVYAIGALIIVL